VLLVDPSARQDTIAHPKVCWAESHEELLGADDLRSGSYCPEGWPSLAKQESTLNQPTPKGCWSMLNPWTHRYSNGGAFHVDQVIAKTGRLPQNGGRSLDFWLITRAIVNASNSLYWLPGVSWAPDLDGKHHYHSIPILVDQADCSLTGPGNSDCARRTLSWEQRLEAPAVNPMAASCTNWGVGWVDPISFKLR